MGSDWALFGLYEFSNVPCCIMAGGGIAVRLFGSAFDFGFGLVCICICAGLKQGCKNIFELTAWGEARFRIARTAWTRHRTASPRSAVWQGSYRRRASVDHPARHHARTLAPQLSQLLHPNPTRTAILKAWLVARDPHPGVLYCRTKQLVFTEGRD